MEKIQYHNKPVIRENIRDDNHYGYDVNKGRPCGYSEGSYHHDV